MSARVCGACGQPTPVTHASLASMLQHGVRPGDVLERSGMPMESAALVVQAVFDLGLGVHSPVAGSRVAGPHLPPDWWPLTVIAPGAHGR